MASLRGCAHPPVMSFRTALAVRNLLIPCSGLDPAFISAPAAQRVSAGLIALRLHRLATHVVAERKRAAGSSDLKVLGMTSIKKNWFTIERGALLIRIYRWTYFRNGLRSVGTSVQTLGLIVERTWLRR